MERKLSPSILNADFGNLGAAIGAVESYADMIHLDVMDGHFVPNITFGPMMVKMLDRLSDLPLDCHLMISEPDEWIDKFAEAGADRIAVHLSACKDPGATVDSIRDLGVSPGLVVSPGTPLLELRPYLKIVDFVVVMSVYSGFGGQKLIPEMLDRVGQIRQDAEVLGREIEIEVDGGVSSENLDAVLEAGADTIVVGASIFRSEDISGAAAEIKERISGFSSRVKSTG